MGELKDLQVGESSQTTLVVSLDLVVAEVKVDELIQTEMDFYKVMKLLYDVYLGPNSDQSVCFFF